MTQRNDCDGMRIDSVAAQHSTAAQKIAQWVEVNATHRCGTTRKGIVCGMHLTAAYRHNHIELRITAYGRKGAIVLWNSDSDSLTVESIENAIDSLA